MTIDDYSQQAVSTMLNTHQMGDMDPRLVSFVFGLMGEGGEVAEKFKKLIRDQDGKISEDDKAEILKELGDILWYINGIATLLGSNLETVAQMNIDKILSRKSRGVAHGSGDNR